MADGTKEGPNTEKPYFTHLLSIYQVTCPSKDFVLYILSYPPMYSQENLKLLCYWLMGPQRSQKWRHLIFTHFLAKSVRLQVYCLRMTDYILGG